MNRTATRTQYILCCRMLYSRAYTMVWAFGGSSAYPDAQ